ncbi:hypothetical protein PMI42_04876 [Bradyrhizobium sp. YR681]|uniref:DUF6950 family protein n=1 Tax=Bradyrhizobium sp. YR681 TaxID=1144344 RepID=UPI0002711499|nr:hypothetical protein [Bradyrhizobium sp. YR681]EJN11861.1 hypothetical protein PMI42_04876 [Bradyrhizobium sp. YR681]
MAGAGVSLADYLDRAAAGRFRYGVLDCCTLMADWLCAQGLCDVMADRRGTYATMAAYKTAIRSEGGMLASCRARFAAAGLVETCDPQPGDVALVLAPIGRRRDGRLVSAPTGAICLAGGLRAIVTSDQGVMAFALPVVAAWSLPHG